MLQDTIIFPDEVPEIITLQKKVFRNECYPTIPFVGLQLAAHSELGFEEYFYPPYHFSNIASCWWIDKFNGNLRVGLFVKTDPKELTYFDANLKRISHFHKEHENIGSPND